MYPGLRPPGNSLPASGNRLPASGYVRAVDMYKYARKKKKKKRHDDNRPRIRIVVTVRLSS